MDASTGLNHCLTFINCQLKPVDKAARAAGIPRKLAITLSRQTGAGVFAVAEKLAALLQVRAPRGTAPWTVFDKNLVEKVLEDHHLPAKLAQFMPEDRRSMIEEVMEEILGLHPPSWTLANQTMETILKLAELGNVILVGRGATVITAKLDHMFHVRLVGSLEKRTARVQEHLGLGRKAALEFILKSDRGRQRYLRSHLRADIDDPLLYDLIVNTDRFPLDAVARLIADATLERVGGAINSVPSKVAA